MKVFSKFYGFLAFLISGFFAVFLQLSAQHQSNAVESSLWFVDSGLAAGLKDPVVLDTRSFFWRTKDPVPGAKPIDWQEISEPKLPSKGNLLENAKVLSILKEYNVDQKSNVLVLGDGGSGFGEEGRIVWSLRQVGVSQSYWLDGKVSEYLKAVKRENQKKISGFVYKTQTGSKKITITKSELFSALKSNQFTILDTREAREYKGETPYGETRGGIIPNAKPFYFKDFIREDGRVKSKEEVLKILSDRKIPLDKPFVTYCTGGIRSAYVAGVLNSYGIPTYNYAGSMWEWSADKNFPVVKTSD
ncbi:rhodanese-like domain-containing protein [Leptospira sp. 96542]|nr:rhodanese-like domain-containing protein [Leptospira sp. 96542]